MALIKTPFEHFKGAKECIVCEHYIPPKNSYYYKKLYCDVHCQEITTLIRRLKKLSNQKKLNLNSLLNKF